VIVFQWPTCLTLLWPQDWPLLNGHHSVHIPDSLLVVFVHEAGGGATDWPT
jgi:hypothetical protein